MRAFTIERGRVAPLERDDVDTDQIIPKQFLKRIERTGFGAFLFHDWRSDPRFVLASPRHAGATFLVTGRNFGCGSSREHAPWALLDYGFRAIIAPSFADIFAGNCTKNGLLPVVLPEAAVREITRRARDLERYELTVDLLRRRVEDDHGLAEPFPIGEFQRRCLIEGLDEIGLTLRHEHAIEEYEERNPPSHQFF